MADNIEWKDIPEFTDLAKRMKVKLNKSKPFGITKRNITSIKPSFRNQVILGQNFISTAEKKQILAVVAHEFTHIKQQHDILKVIFLVITTALFKLYIFPSYSLFIEMLLVIVIIFISLFVISWIVELLADRGAARNVDKDSIISALEYLKNNSKKIIWDIILHPPDSFRIYLLKKL